jgi:serine beta-lactamase-like protein LACTB, mitochondrial
MNRPSFFGSPWCKCLIGFLFLPPLASGLAGSAVLAATPGQAVKEARARVLEDFVPKVPGLAAAAGLDGKLIWSEGFGLADLQAKKPVSTETLFRIGSISKPVTAAGLMRLVERGQLDLDADIHRYVPDFPDKGQVITTRELAGHLAGIRH